MENYELYLWLTKNSQGFDFQGRENAASPEKAIIQCLKRKNLSQVALAQAFVVCEYSEPALTMWGVTMHGDRLTCERRQP